MLLKKAVYDKLLSKVNNIDTSGFVLKANYDTDKSDLEKEISYADRNSDISGLVKKQIIMLKLPKQKVKYLMLVIQSRKTDYDAKISEIENKYITAAS